jgi:peptidoglycan-associated lipoprotein
MRIAVRKAPFLVLLGGLVLLCSCSKKPPANAAQARENPAPAASAAPARSAPAPAAASDDVLAEDLATLNRHGYLRDVYFDFDEAVLRDDARRNLAADATWLEHYSSTRIVIEGHCDDRGTEAYNLSLGDRRANAAREYLASLGVDGTRVQVVSYGKERPFCDQNAESCWQENRRGHFVVTAK